MYIYNYYMFEECSMACIFNGSVKHFDLRELFRSCFFQEAPAPKVLNMRLPSPDYLFGNIFSFQLLDLKKNSLEIIQTYFQGFK